MKGVDRYEDLRVYRLCDQLRKMVRPLLRRPQFNRDLDLKDQLRRAVERPCPNIAEGFLRFNPRENAKFVRVARGSVGEAVVHMGRALDAGFVTDAEHARVVEIATQALKSLAKYIVYLDQAEIPGTPPPGFRQPPRRTQRPPWGQSENETDQTENGESKNKNGESKNENRTNEEPGTGNPEL